MNLFYFIAVVITVSVSPIKELYELKKYDQIVLTVNNKSSIEDQTYKVFSLYHLNNYDGVIKDYSLIKERNGSDSLKTIAALAYYYVDNMAEYQNLFSSIKDEKCLDFISDRTSYVSDRNIIKSSSFKPISNQGFCFDSDGRLVYSSGNKLLCEDKELYVSKGKYVGYPFIKNGKIYFSGNMFDGGNLSDDQLAKIGRDRISKMQLFVGDYTSDGITNVQLLPVGNIEYDYLSPWVDDQNVLYFSSNMVGGYGGFDVYRSVPEDGKYVKSENVGNVINSNSNDLCYVEYKNKFIVSSDKEGLGRMDLFIGLKNSRLYGNVASMGSDVNSKRSEYSFQIYKNKGYYSAMLTDGSSTIRVIDILNPHLEIDLEFKNTFNRQENVFVDSMSVDYGNGIVYFDRINDVKAAVFVDNQFNSDYSFLAYGYENNSSNQSEIIDSSIVYLKPKFYGVVQDYITGLPLSGVEVFAIRGTDTIKHYTDNSGSWYHAIEENDGWSIHIGKTGYKSRMVDGDKLNPVALRDVSIGIDTKKGTKLEIRNIYFEFGKAVVTDESKDVLDRIYQYMVENPTIKFEVSAHTDSRGSDQANMKLSVNRALAAYTYLINKGLSKNRMTFKGYGETLPVNKCVNGSKCTEEEYQLNRRVEIKIM